MISKLPIFSALNCTINTTEDCNLRCKYCYEVNKRSRSIDFVTAKKFIDLIFSDDDICCLREKGKDGLYDGLVIDFIGGDSLVDPKLLDDILSYLNYKYTVNDKFKIKGWKCSISSNGTLFSNPDVRNFLEKWKDNISLGVSIDGCPEIHDLNRVFPNGEGSMNSIIKNWDWYRKTFPIDSLGTKATCARSTIPYLYKSLKFMHEELGLKYIHQNFIMEDTGCTEEDYKELDHQLEMCVNYCLLHKDDLYWSMIDRDVFIPKEEDRCKFYTDGRCGSGCMPACGIDGNIYPCFRWLPHTQCNGVGAMCVGNVDDGFIHKENFIKVQEGSIRNNCTKEEKCRTCEYEPCCTYCIGGCYAEYNDFIRTTYICEIIKLQCKWTSIYWSKYEELHKMG